MSYKDWMPRKRKDQLAMAKTWLAQLPVSGGAWSVTEYEISELTDIVDDVENAEKKVEKEGASPVYVARVRLAYAAMVKNMRFLRKRKFFSPPMTDDDWIRLTLTPPDFVRTPHVSVSEVVEFELKLRGIREILVNFWIKGASGRAKPDGYDGAVIIWAVLDEPPDNPDALTRHTLASRTPYAVPFTEEERGKTVYIAACWQNGRGLIGKWSEIQSAIIP
jgi:hypothetical protein